ncbi:Sir2 family NAD-dependent protein deacetylase [Labrenzia sp. PHM005]|uniref:SIR2 family NAD-dependent protein deacylase n=1 Tax=Labrenzia sp. PHM005 TaxID=2590016 RepID=UPI0011406FDB|nr:Sir2 family NAD-dependent protein deacetylase [Labrenzia sp. PHM005]QDG77480.1 NAD-dependent deacetylase [Labrenzia sp. PHM005]
MNIITELAEAQEFVSSLAQKPGGSIVALSGAGISTESGIPDFRSPGGIWSQRAPVQYQDFLDFEESRLEDWDRRFEMLGFFEKAEPNHAHRALSRLSAAGQLKVLITQNVDGLHQRSGVQEDKLIELHGNSTYATCLDCGAIAALEDQEDLVARSISPTCGKCGGLLKAAVISFGQSMPQDELQKAAIAAQNCETFLVLGSSLVVHPAAQLPVIAAQNGADLVILNREETPIDSLAGTVVRTPLSETFAIFPMK